MTFLLESPSFNIRWEPHQGALWLESPGRSLGLQAGFDAWREGKLLRPTTADFKSLREEPVRVEDAHGSGDAMVLHFELRQNLLLTWQIRLYPSRPFVLLRLKVTNTGNAPLILEHLYMRTVPHGLRPLDAPSGFYASGWQSWSPAGFIPAQSIGYRPAPWLRPLIGPFVKNARVPWHRRPGRFWSNTVGAIVTAREALVAGGVSLGEQFVQLRADLRANRLSLLMQSQADDIPVAPGAAVYSEWFYLEWVPTPQPDPLAQYACAVARQMQLPTPRPAPPGWCSWYMYGQQVGETDVIENLAAAALLSDSLPLEIIQLDQGFELLWGDWTTRNERFPHSLDWLAARIGGSGFTPGLWLAPFIVHPRSQVARTHPDWVLRDRKGRPVKAGLAGTFMAHALDLTHPEVEEHLRDLVETAVDSWGYRYLKLDYLYAGALPGVHFDPQQTCAQIYRRGLRLIREAAGADTYLVGCGAPLGPSLGLVDAMRIGADTGPHWAPNFRGWSWPVRGDLVAPGLCNSLQNTLTRAWMHERWWINDPDTLLMRDNDTALTEPEVVAQATLIGLNGGVLALSDALPQLKPERRQIAEALLPPLTEGMDTLELFQRAMPEVVTVPMLRAWGRWRLVGLFNWQEQPAARALPRDLPDLSFAQAYHIVDFWAHRYYELPLGAPIPTFTLPPHGGVLLSIRSICSGPHLVATTFHISQGGEVTAWDVTTTEVRLMLELGRVAQGEVWLALPARPTTVWLDDALLPPEAVRAVAPGIWAIACTLKRRGRLRVQYA